ncbi:hypothetical protein [Confluentibacter flavum]|uniref:DUF4390 domain-containing protein n=1 Tax=Confluentibacter flavum TaxID=1909700 RepID=A0A2N3HIA1_9FLAO|nr:hypothetical protein [Confluentibacter flavum]PKQ44699.1 hypothetical protein CSW08_11995 [Confluentibacter flavum]
MMHKFFYLLLIMACTYSCNLFAQEKFEKESRIKPNDVPVKALVFIDSLNFNNKVKWYKEEGLNRKSIEGKFKHNKVRYSVEFDTLGHVEDIEIEVNWKDLRDSLKDSIFFQLRTDCLKHKIVKVQKQYTGSESQLFSILKADINNLSLTTKYELIVRCRQQNELDLFEYLFNDTGKLISTSKIVFKNSSHLEY